MRGAGQGADRRLAADDVVIDEATARRDMGKAKIDHVRSLLAEPVVAAPGLPGTAADRTNRTCRH